MVEGSPGIEGESRSLVICQWVSVSALSASDIASVRSDQMLRVSAEDKKEKSIPQSGCASARPAPRQHGGPLWLSRSRAQKFKSRERTLQTCVLSLSSSPPPCTGLFHSGQRRVPTSSSCPHNNLQLFSSCFRLESTPRFWRAGPAVRRIRAPSPRARSTPGGLAPLWMTGQLNTHTVHTCGHFFCQPSEQWWRARTDDHSPAAASFLARGRKTEKGRGSATVTLRRLSEQSRSGRVCCQTPPHLPHAKVSLSFI